MGFRVQGFWVWSQAFVELTGLQPPVTSYLSAVDKRSRNPTAAIRPRPENHPRFR